MILCDSEIIELGESGNITPFFKENVNPASYNLTLGNTYRKPERTKDGNGKWSRELKIPDTGLILYQNDIILSHSLENTLLPDNISAEIYSRSTTGRRAIEHLHAGFGECGYHGQWTFEIISCWPFKRIIYAGDKLFQMVFIRMSKVPEKNYRQKESSHYIGSNATGTIPDYLQLNKEKECGETKRQTE